MLMHRQFPRRRSVRPLWGVGLVLALVVGAAPVMAWAGDHTAPSGMTIRDDIVSGGGGFTGTATHQAWGAAGQTAIGYSLAPSSALINHGWPTLDTVQPRAITITPSTTGPTNADTVTFTVTFDEEVFNFDADNDLVFTETGDVAHTGVTITGDRVTFTVDVTGVTGDGTLAIAVSTTSDVQDAGGNLVASSVTSDDVTLDNTGPEATTLVRTTPSPTNGSSCSFRVDFDEEVMGLNNAADLDVTATGTAAFTNVAFTPFGALSYYIQFTGLSGAGTLTVAISTTSDVTDLYGNTVRASASANVLVDRVAPTVTVNTLTTNDTTPTVTGTVNDGAGTGIQSLTVTVNGVQYTATVTGTNWSAEVTNALAQGTYNVQARATDLLNNIGNDATTNELVIDFSVPAATVNSLRTSDTTPTLTGTATAPVGYTITQVTVTVNGQGYAANISALPTWTANVTNALAEGVYNVQVQARDNIGRVGTDGTLNELTIDLTGPVATITLADANPSLANTVEFDVSFNEPIQAGSFNAADVTVTGTLAGIAVTPVTVSGSGQTYTVAVSVTDGDADGTLGIQIGTGVTDPYGNATAGAVSELYTISNWYGFTQVPSDARVYVGEPVSFSVQADYGSSTPTYQWKHDNLEGKAVIDVGTNSPTYDIVAATPADAGQYWCVVTYGGVEYASASAMLDVVGHLSITQHPEGGTKAVGDSHTFTVATEGGIEPLDYVWYKGEVAITGATESSYSITSLTVSDSNSYYVVVSDSGTDVQASTTATLEVSGSSLPAVSGAAALAALAGLFAAGGLTALRRRRS